MAKTISSQRYRNPDVVAEKRAARDYTAAYAVVAYDGDVYRVVVDGHHRIEAARLDGVAVAWREVDASDWGRDAEEQLAAMSAGDDYYDLATGRVVW